ncbi:uncharacterized protein [Spinacia oleracea]|uniref:NAF domain-containing protein n=1 Tax=Spinacia oleracea TaxID=3562 RepID=A0ABM3RQ97_SPIOL|nr:uncharacterized protein LOC130471587 [Spinacia oleracea]
MHHSPTDQLLADQELDATNMYRVKHKAYLEYLKQKAKVDWIKAGDENTTIFHQSIKSRNVQNQVYSIHDMNGVWKDDPVAVSEASVSYYKTLLGTTHAHRKSVIQQIVHIGPVCSSDHKAFLNAPYTVDEIKEALFSIKGNKAHEPDGFGSPFYRDAWQIVGSDIIAAVLDVLQSGKLLKEVNHTVITLIPKTKCPRNSNFSEFDGLDFQFYHDKDRKDLDDGFFSMKPPDIQQQQKEQQVVEGEASTSTPLNAFDLITFTSGLDLTWLFNQNYNPSRTVRSSYQLCQRMRSLPPSRKLHPN